MVWDSIMSKMSGVEDTTPLLKSKRVKTLFTIHGVRMIKVN